MCGRITLKAEPAEIAAEFELAEAPDVPPRYNIAPTQPVAAVRLNVDGQRACDLLQWGLVPPWSNDPRVGAKMFNARSETVADKPSFREAFAHRRCLVPVSGFYEWRKQGATSLPHYFTGADGLLSLAGLWERWEFPGGDVLETCSILTTAANRLMKRVHHRMPVILSRDQYEPWLTTPAGQAESLHSLLQPAAEDVLRVWPVSDRVNRVSSDDPDLIVAMHDDPPDQLNLF